MQRSLAAVRAAVQRTLGKYEMVRGDDRVLAAVSGGSDSVGLLGLLALLRERLGFELICAHVNHRLRGADADADEACVALAARRLGVPFVRAEVPPGLGEGGNVEERAREARYEILHRLARENGCRLIATGHTEDDQAETVLLRLVRGTGPEGMGGIRAVRSDGVIRPLIECSRASIEETARALGLEWREDSSNRDLRFQRNVIRSRVLPALRELNPRVSGALARTSALVGGQAELVRALLNDWVQRGSEVDRLRLEAVREIPSALRGHLVRHWLVGRGVGPRGLTGRHVRSVLVLAAGSRASGCVDLPGGWVVERRYRLLDVGKTTCRPDCSWPPRELKVGEAIRVPGGWKLSASAVDWGSESPLPRDLLSALFDVTPTAGPFLVRRPRRGERVRPLGLGGTRKLSDLFTDRKVPAPERWSYPVVELAGEIVWVPGIVRTDAFALRTGSRRAVCLSSFRD